MQKQQLEDKLSAALENGYIPSNITLPEDAGPLRVIQDAGDDIITVMYRQTENIPQHSLDSDTIEAQDRVHNSQFIYSLKELQST